MYAGDCKKKPQKPRLCGVFSFLRPQCLRRTAFLLRPERKFSAFARIIQISPAPFSSFGTSLLYLFILDKKITTI
jgi:hypothetical protein